MTRAGVRRCFVSPTRLKAALQQVDGHDSSDNGRLAIQLSSLRKSSISRRPSTVQLDWFLHQMMSPNREHSYWRDGHSAGLRSSMMFMEPPRIEHLNQVMGININLTVTRILLLV